MSHTAPRPPSRWSTGAARFGALAIVLLVLYYSVTATLEVRELREQLDSEHTATVVARAQAAEEREALLVRLDTLQTDLDNARAEVASLREQLIAAGLTPMSGASYPQPTSELDARDPQDAPQGDAGTTASAPGATEPTPAATAAPAPVQPAPAPAAPEPPRGLLGGDPLACLLSIVCI